MQKDTMDTMQIRRMMPGDIEEVAAIERATFSDPWSGKGFAESLAADYTLFLVAQTADGRIVGYCGLYLSVDEAEITNVAVLARDRRRGIGDALLAALLAEAAGRGVKRVFLEARVSNRAAIGLYEKHGFAPCGTRRNFYRRPDEDALFMVRALREREVPTCETEG